jgi:serine/threonine-protein kinase RsbW
MTFTGRGSDVRMKHIYETSFFSEIYNVKTAIGELMRFLRANAPQMKAEELNDLRLVFSELMCNAVIHGNKQDLSKMVKVTVTVAGNAVNAVITDEGQGFDYISLLIGAAGADKLTCEHGRGIHLVHSLTDSLSFNMKGNQIKFNKKVRSDG